MGHKLPPKEIELYKRCDEVLHYLWDPIGVADVPEARDEYLAYLPQVFKLVLEGAERNLIADYLLQIETESMGLPPGPQGALAAAETLLSWRDVIFEEE